MDISIFLNSAINKVFKILPLKEQNNPYYIQYVSSLYIELYGAIGIFAKLDKNPNYISILNIIKYLQYNEYNNSICKREVFKMITYIKKIKLEVGD